jgi:two-component system phosphate regulon sensor histidine kinase PhoR
MSTRWKLFLSYMLVILVAVGTLGGYVAHEISRRYTDDLKADLLSEAKVVRELTGARFSVGESAALQQTAQRLGREAGLRVTLIAGDGRVLADSEHDPRTMENHAGRPEVLQALAEGGGSSIRHSATLGIDMLYVAVPVTVQSSE